jgi:hypothetical protein
VATPNRCSGWQDTVYGEFFELASGVFLVFNEADALPRATL